MPESLGPALRGGAAHLARRRGGNLRYATEARPAVCCAELLRAGDLQLRPRRGGVEAGIAPQPLEPRGRTALHQRGEGRKKAADASGHFGVADDDLEGLLRVLPLALSGRQLRLQPRDEAVR